jgi:hypothetical protein
VLCSNEPREVAALWRKRGRFLHSARNHANQVPFESQRCPLHEYTSRSTYIGRTFTLSAIVSHTCVTSVPQIAQGSGIRFWDLAGSWALRRDSHPTNKSPHAAVLTWTLGPDHASVLIRFVRVKTVTSPMPYIRIAIVGHRGRVTQIHTESASRWIQESARLFEIPEPRFPSQRLPLLLGHIVLRAMLYNGRLPCPIHAFFTRDSTLC